MVGFGDQCGTPVMFACANKSDGGGYFMNAGYEVHDSYYQGWPQRMAKVNGVVVTRKRGRLRPILLSLVSTSGKPPECWKLLIVP